MARDIIRTTERLGKPIIYDLESFLLEYPEESPEIIAGLLRKGEIANLVASSKVKKSFAALQLAFSVACGRAWLGCQTLQGRVLYIDNELRPKTLAARCRLVQSSLQIDSAERGDRLDVLSVRGKGVGIDDIPDLIASREADLIILDALYRFLPSGTSENDNSQMTRFFDKLDSIADSCGAAMLVVHHTSKGSQSAKSLVDVGSGAGAIVRYVDTHIALREHEVENTAVVEAVCRSIASPAPISIGFEFPLWSRLDVAPVLKARRTDRDVRQESLDSEMDRLITNALTHGPKTPGQLRSETGVGKSRVDRGLARLLDKKWIVRQQDGTFCSSVCTDKAIKQTTEH